MSLNTCSAHDIIATKRCPICHRPLCSRCKTRDGCCSEKCFQSRQKFGNAVQKVHRPGPSPIVTLLKLAVLGGAAYAAARYFGYL